MTDAVAPPAAHIRQLLRLLGDPAQCAGLDLDAWDLLIRTARSARLLGTLAARIRAAGATNCVPEAPAAHLRGALADAEYLRQMTLRQLGLLADVLLPVAAPLLALKGSAYILREATCAAGRLPRDVDLLVERRQLAAAEQALLRAGWSFVKTDAYDQRYYREWSHELPPMQAQTLPLELDLHHAILPPLGRLRPDTSRLIADAVAVPGSPYRVLRPADQVLHAAAHLFQDSDCVGKLRDLVDIDALLRDGDRRDGAAFWSSLVESAAAHGLGRPLWYALAFSRAWLGTPVPAAALAEARRWRPAAVAGAPTIRLIHRVLGPIHPDEEATLARRLSALTLEARSQWLRMPPALLAYHAASKLRRSTLRTPASASAA